MKSIFIKGDAMKTYFVKNKKGNLFLEYNSIIQEIQNKKDNIETRLSKIQLPESKEVMSKEEQACIDEYIELTKKVNYIKKYLLPFQNKLVNSYTLERLKYFWNKGKFQDEKKLYLDSDNYKKIEKHIKIESYFIAFVFLSFLNLWGLTLQTADLNPDFYKEIQNFSFLGHIISAVDTGYIFSVINFTIYCEFIISIIFVSLYFITKKKLFLIFIFTRSLIEIFRWWIASTLYAIPFLIFLGIILIPLDIFLAFASCCLYREIMILNRAKCHNDIVTAPLIVGITTSLGVGMKLKKELKDEK